jgi:hypothetical protein
MRSLIAGLLSVAALFAGLIFAQKHADAHPTFAQALRVDCKVCHTEVPALNAYGRYVARTWYTAIPPSALRGTFPVYAEAETTYDSQAQPYVQYGNMAVHPAGYIGTDWTYHVHQWLVQNGTWGGTDTGWLTYNNLFNHNGHLTIGKSQPAAPNFWNNWSNFSGFYAPTITIGQHMQLLGTGGRWGAAFTYGNDEYVVQFGYYGSPNQLNLAQIFNAMQDKGFQWRVGYDPSSKPISVGFVGNVGTVPLAQGGIDRYSADGVYAQVDPTAHLPGAILYYQIGNDGNPVATGIGARSTAYSAEVYFPIFAQRETLLSLRHEMTNDGLGNLFHYDLIDIGFRPFNYPDLHADGEYGLTSGSKPAWRYYILWTPPFVESKTK